jgi:hypothetical protein
VSRSAVLRSPGYVTLCSGLLTVFLALSAGAFLDPALADTRDPDWAFWLWAIALSALLLRAQFVGLVVGDDRITRRSWLRSKSWPKSEIVGVGRAGYSGLLNRSSTSKRWMMIALYAPDRVVIEVPELAGGVRTTERRLAHLRGAMGLTERESSRSAPPLDD